MSNRGLICFLVASAFVGCAAHAATYEVTVNSNFFSPKDLSVAPGDTVRWVWKSGSHTVTSGTNCRYDGKYWDKVIDSKNKTFEWTVPSDIGVDKVAYFCKPHCSSGQVGSINIANTNLVIWLDGSQENPLTESKAKGSGTFVLDKKAKKLSWDFSFSGLEGTQTGAHIHGPARVCENANVIRNLSTGSPVKGNMTVTDAQISQILKGLWYVNIHSNKHPDGEIRGQIMPPPLDDPISEPIVVGDIRVDLQPVASGMAAPNWGESAPGDSRLFVVDQNGKIWVVNPKSGETSVFFDVSSRLHPLGLFGEGTYDERGFLGIAFHPDYQNNGKLYTFTTETVNGEADFSTIPEGKSADCQSVIAEWTVPNPSDPASVPDPNSRRELFKVDKPQFNHNGGVMAFGPDGYLYISFGDGGGADDQDGQSFLGPDDIIFGHGCGGNAQDLTSILGKIVRIDPLGSNSNNGNYGIPADNPYVGVDGLDEIWASGLRNVWRMSFDPVDGTLYAADVGQNFIEEVDIITRGGNYGWHWKEGTFNFVSKGNASGEDGIAYVTDVPLDMPAGLTDPIVQYDHDEGLSIIGGFVYGADAIPALQSRYVFAELARTFSNDGRLFYIHDVEGLPAIAELSYLRSSSVGLTILGFGRDSAGNVYVMGNTTATPFGETGVVWRIGPDRGDMNCDGSVNFEDIDAFVEALTGEDGYNAAYPNCTIKQGDVDGSGGVDFNDIDGFIECLIVGVCP